MRLFIVVLIMMAGLLLSIEVSQPSSAAPSKSPTPPTIAQLQTLSALVTTRVEVADVQETEIRGYTGGIKAALLIRGDFLLTVDLSKARFDAVDQEHRTATLVLPLPQVSSPRLDHQKTRLFAIQSERLWMIVPSKEAETALANKAYRGADEMVRAVGQQGDCVAATKAQAEKVLECFFQAISWRVKVLWADH